MKNKSMLMGILFLLSFSTFFYSCDMSGDEDKQAVSINGISWYVDNVDPSFWSNGRQQFSLLKS
jgi:hypothetical protein